MSAGCRPPAQRLLLLVACIAAGVVVGLAGRELVGDTAFLAVPLFIALGWLWVGDPQQCRPPSGGGDGRPPAR